MLLLRLIRGFVLAIGCWWLLVTFTPVDDWWASRLAQPWDSGKGDVLVVLGGDSLGDGVLGSTSYWRAVYTVRAMRAQTFRRVVITGGSGSAEAIREFVLGNGLDTSNVVLETESHSTRENVLRSIGLIGPGKVVLLTSEYHVWRASRAFRKAGVEVVTSPVPDVRKRSNTWYLRAGLFVELAIETGKIGWYRWKGWI
jgi:uncharacterized SAM-binding protein YcdF (DUF218 family)